ncbi:MAG: hypothetical protein E7612_01515 [Ruminococcaceae bacterium]|nr:hypothetical protein [Oscillospiraceae bacterium]
MKRIINVFLFLALIFALTSFVSRGVSESGGEYLISSDGADYIFSVYKNGGSVPIARTQNINEISSYISKLSEGTRIVFGGISVYESFDIASDKYILTGSITLSGAGLSLSGDTSLTSFSANLINSDIRIKNGCVTFIDGKITSDTESAFLLDYSSEARLTVESGIISSSSKKGTVILERGTLVVNGGNIISDVGPAINSSSTLILSGSPNIDGGSHGIAANTPITLANRNIEFSGRVSVKYLDSFNAGSISCVFYSASENSLRNIVLYDKNESVMPLKFFESYKGISERNFGAVYLPFKADFYSGDKLIFTDECISGERPQNPAAPEMDGYEFLGWVTAENPDRIYDFTNPLTKNTSFYSKYRLMPPSFSFSSMEFVYDGYEREFGIDSLSHPLMESAVINYAWYKDGVLLSESGPSIKISKVSDSGEYKCSLLFTYGKDSAVIDTPSVNLSVKKATVEIPSPSAKYYSGEFQSPDIYSTYFYTVSASGGISVGVYPVKLTLKDSENCEFYGGGNTVYVDFEIIKSENFFTDGLTVYDIYEGMKPLHKAHARFGEVKFLYSDSQNGVFSETAPDKAGEYYCIAVVSGCENYTALRSSAVEFRIIEEKISGVSIYRMPDKKVYSAFEHFLSDGLELAVNYNSSRTEIVGADKISIKYQIAENLRYGDNAVIASYLDASVPVPITVNRAEYDLSEILFENTRLVYDGTKKSIDFSGTLPMGVDGTELFAKVIGGGVDAGEYVITLSFSTVSKNYRIPENMYAVLTVLPYESEVVFSSLDFVYDGNQKCPSAYYKDVQGRKVVLEVFGARSLAGEYTASVNCADENYKLVGTSVSYVIRKADYDFSGVSWSCNRFVYDGEEKNIVVTGLPNGVSVIGYSDNKAVSAGKYIVKAAVLYDDLNYNQPPDLSCEWQILKADYDLSKFSFVDSEYIFDGSAKYPGLIGEMPVGIDGIFLEYRYLEGVTHVVDSGRSVEIEFFSRSKNYNIPDKISAQVEILPLGVTVNWGTSEFVFNMLLQAPTAEAEECAVSVLGGMRDAGEYTATAVSLNPDYTVLNSTRVFKILKAENVWIENPTVKDIFEGAVLSPRSVCLGGTVVYEYFSKNGEPLSEPPSAHGEYYMQVSSCGDRNYLPIKSDKIPFKIIEVIPISMSVSMTRQDFSAFEKIEASDCEIFLINNDGSRKRIDISEVFIEYQNLESLRFGDGGVIFKYLDFAAAVILQVKKADYDLSGVYWSGCEATYDGEEKFCELVGLPDGVLVREYVGGRGKTVGNYPVSAILDYDVKNYNPPSVSDSILVIKKRTVEYPKISSLVYNGKAQIPDVVESPLYKTVCVAGRDAGKYSLSVILYDSDNYEFQDGKTEAELSFEIMPRDITVTVSDLNKYKLSSMPKPKYNVSAGEVIDGDELGIVFEFLTDEVGCRALNKNYSLTVINGRIIRHNSLSEKSVLLIFILFLVIITLLFIGWIIKCKRKDILHYFSVLKYRGYYLEESENLKEQEKKRYQGSEEKKETSELNEIEEMLSVDAEHADSLISDSLAKSLVQRRDLRIETSGNKKSIINVDTLSENFEANSRVDVNVLKEKSLVPYDTAYIKVLARGILDKPLSVYANDFSLSAVKMIALTGGEAVRVVTVKKGKNKKKGQNS